MSVVIVQPEQEPFDCPNMGAIKHHTSVGVLNTGQGSIRELSIRPAFAP